jgi:thiol-disulfide isomerase/thioredoxin
MNRTLLISTGIVIATFAIVAFVQGWIPTAPQQSERGTNGPEPVRAAAFTLADIETGEVITLETYEDEPLVIHVFASWCALCTGTARSVASYADQDPFNVLLIAADSRETDAQLIAFKERVGRDSWRIARLTPEVERAYGVRSLDTKFVIDAQGSIIHSDSRSWSASDAQRYLEAVV